MPRQINLFFIILISFMVIRTSQATTVTAAVDAPFSKTPADLVKQFSGAENVLFHEPNVGFDWSMSWAIKDNTTIYISVHAKTSGWVGLGIVEAAGMRGADIMMGHVADGKGIVGDYYATSNAKPTKDGCQDWTIHFAEEAGGYTLLVVSRKLVTTDINDRPITTSGKKRSSFLAAYGEIDSNGEYMQHTKSNRIKFVIDLKDGKSVNKTAWSAQMKNLPSMTSIELTAGSCDDVDICFISISISIFFFYCTRFCV